MQICIVQVADEVRWIRTKYPTVLSFYSFNSWFQSRNTIFLVLKQGMFTINQVLHNRKTNRKTVTEKDVEGRELFLAWRGWVGVSKTRELYPINTVETLLSLTRLLDCFSKYVTKLSRAFSSEPEMTGWLSLCRVLIPLTLRTLNPLTLDAWISTSLKGSMYSLKQCKPDWSIAESWQISAMLPDVFVSIS